jgi:hypothetical protein
MNHVQPLLSIVFSTVFNVIKGEFIPDHAPGMLECRRIGALEDWRVEHNIGDLEYRRL